MSSSLDSLTTNLVRGCQRLFGFEEYTSKQYELLVKREFIHMNICPAGIDSKKPNFLLKKRFIENLICRGLAPKIMNMRGQFGKNLESKTWENTKKELWTRPGSFLYGSWISLKSLSINV